VSGTDWLVFMAWEFFVAVLVGMWIGRARDRRALNRLIVRTFTRGPMSTTPPTLIELRAPVWEAWRMEQGRISDIPSAYIGPREDA
jgi:hypothetical protein